MAQFPTPSDALLASTNQETYGLRTQLIGGENYSDASAADIFIHGRDYGMGEPQSPGGGFRPDQSSITRTYYLFADNQFSGTTWVNRSSFVSPDRLKIFVSSLLGYPFCLYINGKRTLFRHIPEPFRSGPGTGTAGGLSWTYYDVRGGGLQLPNQTTNVDSDGFPGSGFQGVEPTAPSNAFGNNTYQQELELPYQPVLRYDLHATDILSIRGVVEGAQPDASGYNAANSVYNPTNRSAIWNPADPGTWNYPTEAYNFLEIVVKFERLPYECYTRNLPGTTTPDPAYGGEYSRFLVKQENALARALQIRNVVNWFNGDGTGQPPAEFRASNVVSSTEGFHILASDQMLSWQWLDVPYDAMLWGDVNSRYVGANPALPAGQAPYNLTGITNAFGAVNMATFPIPGYSPFTSYPAETLLFQTASRKARPSLGGMPVYDITFFFQYSPGNDGYGNWNRVINKFGYYQRVVCAQGINGGNPGTNIPVYPNAGVWTNGGVMKNFDILFQGPDSWY